MSLVRSRGVASLAVALVIGGSVGAVAVLVTQTLAGDAALPAVAVAAVVVLGLGTTLLLGASGQTETTYW